MNIFCHTLHEQTQSENFRRENVEVDKGQGELFSTMCLKVLEEKKIEDKLIFKQTKYHRKETSDKLQGFLNKVNKF